MTFDEYRAPDALSLAELIRCGSVSAVEVMAATLQRLDEVNPQVNAVTYLHHAAVDAGMSTASSTVPFAGEPHLIKDLHVPVRDMPLTHGSRLFAGQIHDLQPAISLAMSWSDDRLPIGVQLAAPFGDDARLLALAAQLERTAPWFDRTAAL